MRGRGAAGGGQGLPLAHFQREPGGDGYPSQIAQEAGVSPAGLLHHFESKKQLLHAGRYRADVDPAVKAVEIVAFLYGMETSWLLDPSTPLNKVFGEYTCSLARQLTPSPPSGTR